MRIKVGYVIIIKIIIIIGSTKWSVHKCRPICKWKGGKTARLQFTFATSERSKYHGIKFILEVSEKRNKY